MSSRQASSAQGTVTEVFGPVRVCDHIHLVRDIHLPFDPEELTVPLNFLIAYTVLGSYGVRMVWDGETDPVGLDVITKRGNVIVHVQITDNPTWKDELHEGLMDRVNDGRSLLTM